MKRLIASILAMALVCNVFAPVAWAEDFIDEETLTAEEQLDEGSSEEPQEETPAEGSLEETVEAPVETGEITEDEQAEVPAPAEEESEEPAEVMELGELPAPEAKPEPQEIILEMDLSDYIYQAGGTKEIPSSSRPAALASTETPYTDWDAFEQVVVEGLSNVVGRIDFTSLGIEVENLKTSPNVDMAWKKYVEIINRHPELFYVKGQASIAYDGTYLTAFIPSYTMTGTELDEAIQTYEGVVSYMLNEVVKPSMTLEQKLLALHDKIALNVAYDHSTAAGLTEGHSPNRYNAYGALVDGVAVCQGYSMAYRDLLNRLKITNETCESDQINHIWNQVYMNGNWYHIDITWDDPVSVDHYDIPGRVVHNNFLRSDSGFKNHFKNNTYDWDKGLRCHDASYESGQIWENINVPFIFHESDGVLWAYYINTAGNADLVGQPSVGAPWNFHFDATWNANDDGTAWYGPLFHMDEYDGSLYVFGSRKVFSVDMETRAVDCVYELDTALTKSWNIYAGSASSAGIQVGYGQDPSSGIQYITIPWEDIKKDNPKSGTCGKNVNWELDEDGILTISGSGEMNDFASFSDTPWAEYADSIVAVAIADDVANIGENAFSDCGNIKKVTLNAALEIIGQDAFRSAEKLDCVNMEGALYDLAKVYIQPGNDALFSAKNYNVESWDLPETYPIQGRCGDDMNWALDKDGVLTISGSGIMWDYNFFPVYLDGEWFRTSAPWGLLNDRVLEIRVMDGVKTVGAGSFFGCRKAEKVSLPDSLTWIGEGAFRNCDALESIEIPGGVNFLCEQAFMECVSLTEVTIHEGVDTLGAAAFAFCENLNTVNLPLSLTCVDEGVFTRDGSDPIENVTYAGTASQWNEVDIGFDNAALTEATIHVEPEENLVAINEENFPDENFRKIAAAADMDEDGVLSEAERENITELVLNSANAVISGVDADEQPYSNTVDYTPNTKLTSAAGIEFFTGLIKFSGDINTLVALDLSQNTNLKSVQVDKNQLADALYEATEDGWKLDLHNLLTEEQMNGVKSTQCYAKRQSDGMDWHYGDGVFTSPNYVTFGYSYDIGFSGMRIDVKVYDSYVDPNALAISTQNFPDEALVKALMNNADVNPDGAFTDRELQNTHALYLNSAFIKDLAGIECFTNLEELYCQYNMLTFIDLSAFTNLMVLNCSCNNLVQLDLSHNPKLEKLFCDHNRLRTLDLSGNGELGYYVSVCPQDIYVDVTYKNGKAMLNITDIIGNADASKIVLALPEGGSWDAETGEIRVPKETLQISYTYKTGAVIYSDGEPTGEPVLMGVGVALMPPPITDEETEIIVKEESELKISETGVMSGITEGTTVEALVDDLGNKGEVVVTNAKGDTLSAGDKVGTGCTVSLASDPSVLVTIMVSGDLDGDGDISVTDIVATRQAALRLSQLEGVYLQAATPVSGSSTPDVSDITAIRQYVLKVIEKL